MVGAGAVFRMYRDGPVEADDEVAVAHADGPRLPTAVGAFGQHPIARELFKPDVDRGPCQASTPRVDRDRNEGAEAGARQLRRCAPSLRASLPHVTSGFSDSLRGIRGRRFPVSMGHRPKEMHEYREPGASGSGSPAAATTANPVNETFVS